ncbi:hypothetical protein C8Q75DRAFT_736201 [Abortiporus biennis]|nr:hypothetical protein C8Q75DRAFT_736201 [Abortiporus biennis]
MTVGNTDQFMTEAIMEPYNLRLDVLEGTQLENQWLNDMRHVFEIYESHLPPFVIPNPSLRSPRLPLELLKLIVENLDGTIEEERETLWCLCLTNQDLSFYSRPILYRDIEFDLEEDSWRLKLLLQVLEKRKYLRTMVLDLTFCRDTTASVYTPNLTDHTELNPGPTSTTVTTTTTGSQPNTYEFQWKTLQGVKVFHQLFLRGPTLLPNLQKLCLSDIPQLHPSITSLRRFPFFKVRELVIWDTQFTSLLDLRRLMENIFPDILHLSLNHVDFQFSHVSFYPPTPSPNFNLNQDQDHGFRDDTGQDGDTTTATTTTSAAAQPRRLGRVQVNLEELESWQLSPRALSIIEKWISTRVNTFKSIKSLHIPNEALSWLRICGKHIRDLTIYWPTRKDPNSNPQMNMMVNLDTDDSRSLYAYPNTIQDPKTFELLDHTLSQVSLSEVLTSVDKIRLFFRCSNTNWFWTSNLSASNGLAFRVTILTDFSARSSGDGNYLR